jgi:hypothetical protein
MFKGAWLLLLLQAARFAATNIEGITCLAQDTAGDTQRLLLCYAVAPSADIESEHGRCISCIACSLLTYGTSQHLP